MAWNQTNNKYKRQGNTIETETINSFRHSKCEEIITLEPPYVVYTRLIKGPIVGTKIIRITAISERQCLLEVSWDLNARGFTGLFNFIIVRHISQGTLRAIERISTEAEQQFSKIGKS